MEYLVVYFAFELLDGKLHVGVYEFRLGQEFLESLLHWGIDVINRLFHGINDIIIET